MSIIPILNEDHWHELRSKHVGGSEVAALFNDCSYLTHLELWLIKHGDTDGMIEDNERMFWGRTVEDAVAHGVAIKKGWRIENWKAYFTCDDTPGMGCTPDRIIFKIDSKIPGLLQIKNVDRLEYMKWEDGEPPMKFQLQLQHELACAGYTWGALALLIGGNELKLFEYQAHAGAIDKIKTAINKFWESVRDGQQPPAVADDYEILKELYPGQDTKLIDLSTDNEIPSLCALALEAAERRKSAEKEEKKAKATILQKMGDAGRAMCTGFSVKKTIVSRNAYMVESSTYSKINIKEEKAA